MRILMNCAVQGCSREKKSYHAFCDTHKSVATALLKMGHRSADRMRSVYEAMTPAEKRKLLPRGQRGSTGRKVTVRQMTPEEMALL